MNNEVYFLSLIWHYYMPPPYAEGICARNLSKEAVLVNREHMVSSIDFLSSYLMYYHIGESVSVRSCPFLYRKRLYNDNPIWEAKKVTLLKWYETID